MTDQTAIIILAAGASTRMGRPKQLLPFKGSLLIGHVAAAAIASKPGCVIVVTGAADEAVVDALKNYPVLVTFNKNWQDGMGASIAWGMKTLVDHYPTYENVILCVCDQPFVDAALFDCLAAKASTSGKGIVASEYAGTAGTPVLFHRSYFAQLSNLQGDAGAKKIVRANGTDLATIHFSAGARDVDTPGDYAELLQINEE